MKLNDLKIGVRLGMLSVLLLAAIAFVGIRGVMAVGEVYGQGAQGMETGALIEQSVDVARSAQVQFKIQVQEWKNTLLRGKDPAAFNKYRQAFIDESAATQKQLKTLEALMPRIGMDAEPARKAQQAHAELLNRYLEALKLYAADDPASVARVDEQVKGVDRVPTKMIDDIVVAVLEHSRKTREALNADSLFDYQQARLLLLVSIGLSLLLGLAITWTLVRSIVRPLDEAVQIAQTVAAGDLRSEVVIRGKDETAQLLHSLKEMNDNLAGIVAEVRSGTGAITVAATEIASGNRDLSERTEEQAGSLEETAASMEEITSTVQKNAENTRQAHQLADHASGVARKGGDMVGAVVQTMQAIEESSHRIVEIISVIDGIAFQTNILALNAAVEAAREIKELIDDSVGKINAGSALVNGAGGTMEDIITAIHKVAEIMDDINVANREQSAEIDEVNKAVVQMDGVTQQNAALVEEAAAAAESLQFQAESLSRAVAVFKLK